MNHISLNHFAPYTNAFSFVSLTDPKINDAIVICNPSDAICEAPVFLRSRKSLAEHIEYINSQSIKKAVIVAEDIHFLKLCPGLEYLWIIPAVTAKDFDYSPLYALPNISWLDCQTAYGINEGNITSIDYSKMKSLQRLAICKPHGHKNIPNTEIKTLLCAEGYPSTDSLYSAFPEASLENLSISQAPIRTLDGIEKLNCLRKLDLGYNRRLSDISALSGVKNSLIWLEIENCGRIQDFSVLSELHQLRRLELKGKAMLPNLNFLQCMPNLEFFDFEMAVADGNLSLCENIPYVWVQNRKHYSHKNSDLKKILPFSTELLEFESTKTD